jgi:hypothetical protein
MAIKHLQIFYAICHGQRVSCCLTPLYSMRHFISESVYMTFASASELSPIVMLLLKTKRSYSEGKSLTEAEGKKTSFHGNPRPYHTLLDVSVLARGDCRGRNPAS